jgi:hypothetical protein
MQRKPDDEAIGAFFRELSEEPWLDRRRRDWPRFFFHITDVNNAVSILRDGELLSRRRVLAAGRLQKSSASEEILDRTSPEFLDCARLYFRPRTPTFWHNEGFWPRTVGSTLQAHCPLPVALLFDAAQVAGQSGVRFSRGNLAANTQETGESVAFLRTLNFRDIYHDVSWDGGENEQLRRARQSEIFVPESLSLSALRGIAVRSSAELTTFRTLLADELVAIPETVRYVGENYRWFFCLRPYAESVVRVGNVVRAIFNPDARVTGPFQIEVSVTGLETGDLTTSTRPEHTARAVQRSIPPTIAGETVRVEIRLDDELAYAGVLKPESAMTLLR